MDVLNQRVQAAATSAGGAGHRTDGGPDPTVVGRQRFHEAVPMRGLHQRGDRIVAPVIDRDGVDDETGYVLNLARRPAGSCWYAILVAIGACPRAPDEVASRSACGPCLASVG